MEARGCMMGHTKYPPSIYAGCQIRAGVSFLGKISPNRKLLPRGEGTPLYILHTLAIMTY